MRGMIFTTAGALALALALAAGAAAHPGGTAGTVQYRATATYSDGSSADRLYAVAAGDLDGDGAGDTAWLRVRCADGAVAAAFEYDVKSPRDTATGQASGKRMHKPFTITKEWGPAPSMTGRSVGWNLKEGKGSRVDHSSSSDASAGKGAESARTSYDVKKVEGTGARSTSSGQAKTTSAGSGQAMAHDDWHEVTLAAGAADLCG